MKKPLIYLASPYAHDDLIVRVERFRQMKIVVAELINQSIIIPYSPIYYTHPLVEMVDEDFDWYEWDLEMLDRCDGMMVCKLPGWAISKGVKIEINHCLENKIPYRYADMGAALFQAAKDIVEELQIAA